MLYHIYILFTHCNLFLNRMTLFAVCPFKRLAVPRLSLIIEAVRQAKEDTEHPTEHPTQRFAQYKAPSGPSLANPYDKVLPSSYKLWLKKEQLHHFYFLSGREQF